MFRNLWRVFAISAVALSSLLAACSSGTSSDPPSGREDSTVTPSPALSIAPAPAQPSITALPGITAPSSGTRLNTCRTGSLLIAVDDSQADGTAGAVYYPLNFTNAGSAACQMYGYPGVSFAAAPYAAARQIGAAAIRSTIFAKVAVRLAPGETAHAWLRVSLAANYAASACQPTTVSWLRVYPPDEASAGYVAHTFEACGATSTTLLTIMPVRAGQATAGSAP
jgi:Protein of unknown function (DUF4232)